MGDITFVGQGSAEWDRMWSVLMAGGINPAEGEGWQYMGTFDGAHQFRNRNVPGKGRTYLHVYTAGAGRIVEV